MTSAYKGRVTAAVVVRVYMHSTVQAIRNTPSYYWIHLVHPLVAVHCTLGLVLHWVVRVRFIFGRSSCTEKQREADVNKFI